jgi:glyoxylase-like metal-dependent hydrolase (beta-lactamase superfamily II)
VHAPIRDGGRYVRSDGLVFETIVKDVQFDGLSFDVRCFLVPHATGIVLIDTGTPGTVELIAAGLDRIGAQWGDITDIVLTHKHFDHVASLAEAVALAGDPQVWVGAEDRAEIPFEGTIRKLEEGDLVRDLRAIATPGHTPGHRSLVHDDAGLLFAGDIAGSMGGVLTRGPEQFTADPDEAERTLRQLATMEWDRMVFSHGAEVADPLGALRRLVAEDGATPA